MTNNIQDRCENCGDKLNKAEIKEKRAAGNVAWCCAECHEPMSDLIDHEVPNE